MNGIDYDADIETKFTKVSTDLAFEILKLLAFEIDTNAFEG